MTWDEIDDRLEERLVTFSMDYHGRTVIIENVPARVDPVTGEEYFSPETLDQLQAIIWGGPQSEPESPTQVVQFAA
jgi:YgiT-type zinc finger domain-containing protein